MAADCCQVSCWQSPNARLLLAFQKVLDWCRYICSTTALFLAKLNQKPITFFFFFWQIIFCASLFLYTKNSLVKNRYQVSLFKGEKVKVLNSWIIVKFCHKVGIYLYGFVMRWSLKWSGGKHKTHREKAHSGARRKWQQRHQRNVREQGYPPSGSVSVGERWGMERLFSRYRRRGRGGPGSRGTRWEEEGGGRRGGGGGGVRREEDHTWWRHTSGERRSTLCWQEPRAAKVEELRLSCTASSNLDMCWDWRTVSQQQTNVCSCEGGGPLGKLYPEPCSILWELCDKHVHISLYYIFLMWWETEDQRGQLCFVFNIFASKAN